MKEDIKFLKELQEELKTQDTDSQASPRFWVLRDYKWQVAQEGNHERETVYLPGSGEAYELGEYVARALERELEYTEEQLESFKEVTDFSWDCDEIVEWIAENIDEDAYIIHEEEVEFIVPNTMFLTKAEAKEHIRLNHYHYTDKVHTYAMTAWRAPKVERLLKILGSFDWDSI